MASGYSQGPHVTRAVFREKFDIELPLDVDKAAKVFALARSPDRGKPIAGHATRLVKDAKTSDYSVSYRDTPVVTYHPDGTYTVAHGGYPTLMTAQRIDEYSPLTRRIELIGKRKSKDGPDGSYYAWDNLGITFDAPPRPEETLHDLRMQWFPEAFPRRCTLPFVRGRLRLDAEGRPVLSSLLEDLAPPEWSYFMGGSVQPWMEAPRAFWSAIATPPRAHQQAYVRLFPFMSPAGMKEEEDPELILLRPSWVGSESVATVWRDHLEGGGPVIYRWIVRKRPGHLGDEFVSGQSTDLELAVSAADRAIDEAHWKTTPPRLSEVLGNLREQLRRPSQGHLLQGPSILDQAVVRVHWQEPWETYQVSENAPGASRQRLPRGPLPGHSPWPWTEDVRVWFELADGTAVGILHHPKTATDELVVRPLHPSLRTTWDTPGVLVAGLLAALIAVFVGG